MIARLVALPLLALLAAACNGPSGSDFAAPRNAGEPSAENVEGVARHATPEGEAVIQLVVEPREVGLGETVTIRLANRGELELLTGLPFNVELWDGDRWVEVPWPENSAFPDIGIPLRPGGSTKPQEWQTGGEPGLYRAVKSALYEDPDYVRPAIELQARATFRVRGSR